jgi:NADH-quinone oxidoreductase subunit J
MQGIGSAHFGQGLSNAPGQSNLELLSQVLFHELLLPFEVTSVLILIAILGAVALAHVEGSKIPESGRTAEK